MVRAAQEQAVRVADVAREGPAAQEQAARVADAAVREGPAAREQVAPVVAQEEPEARVVAHAGPAAARPVVVVRAASIAAGTRPIPLTTTIP